MTDGLVFGLAVAIEFCLGFAIGFCLGFAVGVLFVILVDAIGNPFTKG